MLCKSSKFEKKFFFEEEEEELNRSDSIKKLICCTILTLVVRVSAKKEVINNVGNVRSLTLCLLFRVWSNHELMCLSVC